MRTEKYAYDMKRHRLMEVQQPFYYVGVEIRANSNLPIYLMQSEKNIVAHILPKSLVTVVLYSKGWYLLKTSMGLTGWLPEADVRPENFADVPWAR